jgi:hypothetical protein
VLGGKKNVKAQQPIFYHKGCHGSRNVLKDFAVE